MAGTRLKTSLNRQPRLNGVRVGQSTKDRYGYAKWATKVGLYRLGHKLPSLELSRAMWLKEQIGVGRQGHKGWVISTEP